MTNEKVEKAKKLLESIDFLEKDLWFENDALPKSIEAKEKHERDGSEWCAASLYRKNGEGRATDGISIPIDIYIAMLKASLAYKQAEILRLKKEFDEL